MKRDIMSYLMTWKDEPGRRPILLRGARQVGKSYIAAELGKKFDHYTEIDFEYMPNLKKIFEKDLDPRRIIRDLSLAISQNIVPGKTLLFFDEIQACPLAISALRYFYEKMPELHVIAAGSLLDFVLDEIGMPVGRVIPIYIYPMSFMEFLTAIGHHSLSETIAKHNPREEFPPVLHEKLLNLYGEYMAIGGMPEVVKKWRDTRDLKSCSEIHHLLIDTYRQDFAKYAKSKEQKYVEMIFNSVPRWLGKKFVFSSVSQDYRSRELKPALELLSKAGIVHYVQHTSANGFPLGAEVNPLIFKILFLDIALSQTVLGMDSGQWILDPVTQIVNRGFITEAFVGQEILAYGAPTQKHDLYYWVNEKRGAQAEIDYVTGIKGKVVPIEVKSGVTGTLKSMKVFLESKKGSEYGLQFSQRNFSIDKKRNIWQYPLYAISSAINPNFISRSKIL